MAEGYSAASNSKERVLAPTCPVGNGFQRRTLNPSSVSAIVNCAAVSISNVMHTEPLARMVVIGPTMPRASSALAASCSGSRLPRTMTSSQAAHRSDQA